jgi:ribosomal protein L20
VELDRKILAEIAIKNPDHFLRLVEIAQPKAA